MSLHVDKIVIFYINLNFFYQKSLLLAFYKLYLRFEKR